MMAAAEDAVPTFKQHWVHLLSTHPLVKGVVNCQNSRDKGPPEGNSARG